MKQKSLAPNITKGAGRLSAVLASAKDSAKPPSTGGKSTGRPPQNKARKK